MANLNGTPEWQNYITGVVNKVTNGYTGLNGILQTIANRLQFVKESNDEKLDKGAVSIDYNTAEKIEDKIEGLFNGTELWSGSASISTVTLLEAYTNFNLLEINTSDGESKLIRTSQLTSKGYIGIWGGTNIYFDPSGSTRYALDGYLRATVTNTTTFTISKTRTSKNSDPSVTSILGIGRK